MSVLLTTTIQAGIYVGWFAVVFIIDNDPPDGMDIAMLVGVFVGFTASLNSPLLYLRHQGYRLQHANPGGGQDGCM